MHRLNYHHLYYFWRVAKLGKLTQAAEDLRVSQSALSTQIRQLEDVFGRELFTRSGRKLLLTEAGRMAFTYADEIFRRGEELMALMVTGERPERLRLRIGAVATLSRNFQEEFIAPLLERNDVELVLQSGRMEDLLNALALHSLDLVLSNVPVRRDAERPWRCRRIARQQVSVIGKSGPRGRFRLPAGLVGVPLILPGNSSDIRTGFDALCERWDLVPQIRAEVDDMAMLRLLVRDSNALAILPKVVVRDEIRDGVLDEYAVLPDVHENFYAISIKRQFESPLLKELLTRPESQMLPSGSPSSG